MKKAVKRIGCILLVAVLLVGALPVTVMAEDAVSNDLYYGRSVLAEMENATALLYAYDQIVAGVEAAAESITVYQGTDYLSADEVRMVYMAYRNDHTEHFWLGNSYNMATNGITVTRLMPGYIMSGYTLAYARSAFDAAVERILSGITDSMSEFEKELYLHDAVAQTVTYTFGDNNVHNAYGALVQGKAVCEGYAEAFQYLLQRAGIRSFIVTGESNGEGHAWNIVRINDEYYHVDVTWDDQDEVVYHAYFNQTDEVITEDHTLDATAYPLPVCTSEAAQYFTVMGGRLEEYTVQSVGELLLENDLTAHVYLTGDRDEFLNWYVANIRDIAAAAGVSGSFSYSRSRLGREVVLSIIDCYHRSLAFIPAKEATCTQSGNTAYYMCRSCGRWFADAAATVRITDQSSVLIVAPGHDYSEKIVDSAHIKDHDAGTYWYDCSRCAASAGEDAAAADQWYTDKVIPYESGDASGDGKINNKDLGLLLQHLNGWDVPVIEAACDVTADGKVNNKDLGILLQHLNGWDVELK